MTITAPTSDLVTTTDTTPILTGTVGAAPLGGGETFSVTVNGTTYTTGNGLGISGTTWSLELPTALASGQYDVRAVRSAAGLDIADQTQLELTINDAPTLADTALGLTVAEDAPAADRRGRLAALGVHRRHQRRQSRRGEGHRRSSARTRPTAPGTTPPTAAPPGPRSTRSTVR